ncbi:SDR family oxidoreductase [Enterococcus sp. BWB1-3]|uniref:SDR family NAD(P)-dependent oxidoreductase n=1 Tax=unclassified Enterococcus TaxID=2608891 RepID=UPI0019247FC7|nr:MULTISPECIES: SDR family NAD(P)-dependent oxidoreductase [unclassified Enterococcus]MBL1229926.1 SDR family oxidoreductase [Enterococcus sp. BWB1-3]MCB5955000.1 SDR family oxidoreductase [Enterococcus sp. CWB-B31]
MQGKVAVVTGAAKGIGKAIAKRFAEEGANTVIVDFDAEAGKQTAQKFSIDYADSLFVQADVSSAEDMMKVRNKVVSVFGRVDILIVNAGISYRHTVDDISIEEWQQVLRINLDGSFYTIKAFYKDFQTNQGKIVFITSGSAITGTGGGVHYASSKAGQHGLMRGISKELGPKGVNVNAVAPRVVQTDILDILYPDELSRKELIKKIPISRIGQPEDIANAAFFLAGPESSYIHGQIILADGGRTY